MFPDYVYKRRPNGVRRKKRSTSVVSGTPSSSGESAHAGNINKAHARRQEISNESSGARSLRQSDSDGSMLSPGYDSSTSSTCSFGCYIPQSPASLLNSHDASRGKSSPAGDFHSDEISTRFERLHESSQAPASANKQAVIPKSYSAPSEPPPVQSVMHATPQFPAPENREGSRSGSSQYSHFSPSPKFAIYSFAKRPDTSYGSYAKSSSATAAWPVSDTCEGSTGNFNTPSQMSWTPSSVGSHLSRNGERIQDEGWVGGSDRGTEALAGVIPYSRHRRLAPPSGITQSLLRTKPDSQNSLLHGDGVSGAALSHTMRSTYTDPHVGHSAYHPLSNVEGARTAPSPALLYNGTGRLRESPVVTERLSTSSKQN